MELNVLVNDGKMYTSKFVDMDTERDLDIEESKNLETTLSDPARVVKDQV